MTEDKPTFVNMMTPWEFAPLYTGKTFKLVTEEMKLYAQAYGELLLMTVMHNAQESQKLGLDDNALTDA